MFHEANLKIAANASRLGDDGAFEKRQPIFAQMPTRSTNVEFSAVCPLLPNRCWRFVVYSFAIFISS